jgi:hypothetical protein
MTDADRSRFLAEVDRLEQQHAQLAAIATRTDDARLRDLTRLRREFSEHIGRVGELGEQYFRAREDALRLGQFRSHFSNMRSKTASHQANWPAVSLAEGGQEYTNSARAVTEAVRIFISWLRSSA